MRNLAFVATLALSLVASGFALAEGEDDNYGRPQPVVSTKSRAEVVAEYQQARADGALPSGEADLRTSTPLASTRSRAEVRAETLAAIKSGEVARLNSETNAFDPAFARNIPAHTVAGQ